MTCDLLVEKKVTNMGSVEIKWGEDHYVDKNPNPPLEEDNGLLRLP